METLLIPLHSMPPGMPPFGGLLIAALIAFVAIRLFRAGRVGPVRLGPRGGSSGERPTRAGRTPEDGALATLKDRLAAGNITTEEYLSRSSVLHRPTPEN